MSVEAAVVAALQPFLERFQRLEQQVSGTGAGSSNQTLDIPPPVLPFSGLPPPPVLPGIPSDPSGAAAAARNQAAEVLKKFGEQTAMPPEPGPIQKATDASKVSAELIDVAKGSGPQAEKATQLLQLEALQKILERSEKGSSNDSSDLDALVGLDSALDEAGNLALPRGSQSIERIADSMRKYPGRWNKALDLRIYQALGSHISGGAWSLWQYTRDRIRIAQDQEDDEKYLYMFSALHALHRQGPDSHEALGSLINQCYKATEQKVKDREWTMAWLWTGLPDPRPSGRFERGLGHPSEYAANLSYMRELNTLREHADRMNQEGGQRAPRKPPWWERRKKNDDKKNDDDTKGDGEDAGGQGPKGRGKDRARGRGR